MSFTGAFPPHLEAARNRLPTLFEVLSRRTLAPVDLFSFYIYMRDQQRSVDYLDFWLDVSQHMSLCRHYVRELRRSVLIETPDPEKTGSKRSSAILESFGDMGEAGPSMHAGGDEKNQDQRLSAFLRSETGTGHSPQSSVGSHPQESKSSERPQLSSFMSTPEHLTDSNSPSHTVARADIRASAEKILYTYLLPGAEREIVLPQGIVTDVTNNIEEYGRDDPEVFDAAKDYTFQAMERDAFPGFLRSKALGNLVPPSLMLRLIFGLLSLFGAFWTAFALIFLNYSRHTRCWLILPFTVGVYALASQQYALDPIMALAGYSEYTFMSFARIREPFVRQLLNKRALMVLGVTILIVTALVILFVFVPGKRL
ncbi:regulator of G protein signaling [Xylona heveae TC161]|uniref:Regulator of G protein signaling n=1 Tax=Xylona heveae (strain CBS 132557 / TC161) TaxID=1328760 RepID=A0A165GF43_XYLHT|nr:regulator of G protein signaling [Xylona heveae TC161]KZF22111.1 regulator of G protein signaling [Xylona heveae TC161]